jgi:hypothetical protein
MIYVALALLVAGMVWFFRETGNPMPGNSGENRKPHPRTRQGELLATRKNILRQIENAERVIRSSDGNSDMRRRNLSDLRAILEEIEIELRALEPEPER